MKRNLIFVALILSIILFSIYFLFSVLPRLVSYQNLLEKCYANSELTWNEESQHLADVMNGNYNKEIFDTYAKESCLLIDKRCEPEDLYMARFMIIRGAPQDFSAAESILESYSKSYGRQFVIDALTLNLHVLSRHNKKNRKIPPAPFLSTEVTRHSVDYWKGPLHPAICDRVKQDLKILSLRRWSLIDYLALKLL